MSKTSFRPRRSDDLGLRRALSDRLLPALVAAMVFLAALALAGAVSARGLAQHFQWTAGATLTVQVPPSQAAAAASLLGTYQGITQHRFTDTEIAALLRPWLGEDTASLALDLPAVFEIRLLPASVTPGGTEALEAALRRTAPGAQVERNGPWFDRLSALAASLQACAGIFLLVVTFVATAVVALAVRAGLAMRRDAIEIVHGLGATDGMIARRFAGRVTLLTASGAILGLAFAIPMLLGLASLAGPFQEAAHAQTPAALFASLPTLLWELLPAIPVGAALIGWITAQATVRLWLHGLV